MRYTLIKGTISFKEIVPFKFYTPLDRGVDKKTKIFVIDIALLQQRISHCYN